MRVQLVHPPPYVKVKAMTAHRPSLPLGLALLAAALRQAGHQVTALDAVALAPDRFTPDGGLHYVGLGPEEIAERIDPLAEVIGISNMWTYSWPLVKRITHEVRRRHAGKVIIGGGEHFTGLTELSLQTAPYDFLVLGEGERTAVDLLAALTRSETDYGTIPGIAFRKKGKFIRTPRRERIRDLDALPWPAWDLFDPLVYYRHRYIAGLDRGMTIPMLATRGCPYACTFCSSPNMWTRRWCARTPGKVVDEIAYYRERYGAINFPFQDLTMFIKRDWVVELCRELLDRRLDITWQFPAGTRCEMIDDEIAELLRRTGGQSFAIAPESGSARTRRSIGKKMTEESIEGAARACVRSGLNVTPFLLIGFPQDQWADIRETVRLVRRLARIGIEDIGLGYFFPIPGSSLYDELLARGKIRLTDDFFRVSFCGTDARMREQNNYCDNLSALELTIARYLVLLSFYLPSLAAHPGRLLRVVGNALREKEETKLDAFLVNAKRKLAMQLRQGGIESIHLIAARRREGVPLYAGTAPPFGTDAGRARRAPGDAPPG